MENYQITAFRELKLIERQLKAGVNPRIIYKEYRARFNEPDEDLEVLQLTISCLTDYMKEKGIPIPEPMEKPTVEDKEHELITEFLGYRAYTYDITIDEYCQRFGLEYKNLSARAFEDIRFYQ